ncbi:MAG: hypothetical protein KAI95_18700 [Bacteroidales bacterium]|nr:hypothetical protein [Bacteroidales bacterium]
MKRGFLSILFIGILVGLPLMAHVQPPDTVWNQVDGEGLKQGWWKKSYPDGGLMYRGFFKDDKPAGRMQRFHEGGARKADINFIPGTDISYAIIFYQNSNIAAEGKYVKTLKDSVWSYFSYYSNTLSYLETYRLGNKHGKSVKYYPEGSVSEELMWEQDMRDGPWRHYYEDSTLRLAASYKHDVLHGEFSVYNREKRMIIRGNYVNGRMDGAWHFNNQEGEAEKTLEYDNGRILNREDLDEWAQQYMDEVEQNIGKIPEVDFDNFYERK